MNIVETLKQDVETHPVLKSQWLLERNISMSFNDLILWLSQEYFVSIGFVDWFLLVAAKTRDQNAKIVLVENIWGELGEGKIEDTHVSILIEFLTKLNFDFENHKLLPETKTYLDKMESIIEKGFFYGLGALGPANEYLLKLEYSQIALAYKKLKSEMALPEGKFFQVNLDADEGHSQRMFELIQETAITDESKKQVIEGNLLALAAREDFYTGLSRLDKERVLS
ncbi:iron-containing redox enzyme family protein [Leptospira kanakyensis]|uniref:Iron-containing redox enzyme family protein n=1 Tax=Leptospira kanakyensis TaxID=2484968 RepID=A0A6N4QKC8_9LEPT|nr:iron-containing redox enzyme family protein [Leptospira kanakyensis]MCW7471157.1 iron-containing redox enzyme family protein [Leptospira kanakyensis]TGK53595.1 iron-containing redox enzyme family protein [Leptospira kanakyensis]TGK57389.1 iron-containing redox enzyme family protein [Leptospira kanakyensis]TGK73100.1 iron-containing redox enzyme family protein [Leptospira kanakyensis]